MDASEQPDKEDRTGQDWSEAEVERTVADYFEATMQKSFHI